MSVSEDFHMGLMQDDHDEPDELDGPDPDRFYDDARDRTFGV